MSGWMGEEVRFGDDDDDDGKHVKLLMSQLELFAPHDADGSGASSAPSAPSGFWLCCPRGCRLQSASNPGSTG